MTKIKGKNVLITGGASGIGKIMGRMVLEKGAKSLIIWDINPDALAATKEEFATKGTIHTYPVNIADSNAVIATYQRVKEKCGCVDILINCAGIVRGNKTFDQQTVEDIRLTMDVNTIAPMVLTLQVLPDMLRRNCGHICNIASAGGMLGNPKMSVYGASKWAVIGWSESMRIELQQQKSNVRVTTVAPYFISTGMFTGVRSVFPILKPEPTAKKIIRAIERNTIFAGIPFKYHFIRFWQAILPLRLFDFVFGTVFGIYRTMDYFTGRK
ncbi:MAG: SDR family oxidoreductase [Paludibacteraceae bacterium]|nr:SDR family oxidoreductase [Paludibacteraceae bacterium]